MLLAVKNGLSARERMAVPSPVTGYWWARACGECGRFVLAWQRCASLSISVCWTYHLLWSPWRSLRQRRCLH